MKKLFIFVLALGLSCGGRAYSQSSNACPWSGDSTTCAPYNPASFNKLQATCNQFQQTLTDAESSLCGPVPSPASGITNYGSSTCSGTPIGTSGGVWGNFMQTCFSDYSANAKQPCLWHDAGEGDFHFIWGMSSGGYTQPPQQNSCGNIECFKDTVVFGADIASLNHEARVHGYNTPLSYKRVERFAGIPKVVMDLVAAAGFASVVALTGGAAMTATPLISGEFIGGAAATGVGGAGVISDWQRPHAANTGQCQDLCNKYWSISNSIPALQTALTAQQTALDSMCPAVIPTCDAQCQCTSAGGYWAAGTSTCVCKGLTGSTFDQCVCTTGQGGVWVNGQCDNSGSGSLPSTYGNNNSNSNGNTADNNNTTSGDQASASDSGSAGLSGLGSIGAAGAVGAGAGSASGKSWYSQLKDAFGISSTSNAGQKFNASGKSIYGPGGGAADSSKKKVATQGISSSNSDLFALVTTTYTSEYTKGRIAEPNGGSNNVPGSQNKVKNLGTKPIKY
jgi:hypothetical protein